MKAKFTSILRDKCKDFGLTDKAINDLAELGLEGITEESSDEDFSTAADKLIPYAKMMQKEITRKTAKKTQSEEKQSKEDGKGNEGAGEGEDMPAWAKALNAKMDALSQENASLKAEKAANDRKASITAKAKELGIPDFMMKRMAIADDADIDAELTAFKQELVNGNLLPKDAAAESTSLEATMRASAKSFAESLPNK